MLISNDAKLQGPPDDVAAVLNSIRAWDAATRRSDRAAVLELVTEDCVFLAPGMPPMQGRATLESLLAGYDRLTLDPLFELRELVISGDWAFAWGRDELTAVARSGGAIRSAAGWAITILHRGADQRWRFARGINTKLERPPASSAGD